MHKRIKTLAGLTAACIAPAAFALTSAEAAPLAKNSQPTGTAYVAETTDGGVDIVVSKDRRQIRTALFAYEHKCSDGDTFYDFDWYKNIPISANRSFTYQYDSGPQQSTTTLGVTYSVKQSFSGVLNKAGTKIVGAARSTISVTDPAGATVTCDTGAQKFIAKD